jgi:hypothetical protein
MTLREFYLERRRAEVPVFLSVLKAVPTDHPSYKPHDRSPSAEQLVWTVTSETRLGHCHSQPTIAYPKPPEVSKIYVVPGSASSIQ